MARIKTESLQEGMCVAVDVKNMDGMLLLPRGCELSLRHISILQAWGVSEIEVELDGDDSVSADPLASMPPEVLSALKAELHALFCRPDESDPGFNAVFQAILRRRAVQARIK